MSRLFDRPKVTYTALVVLMVLAPAVEAALLARSGRLAALGFTPEEILARLDGRFAPP